MDKSDITPALLRQLLIYEPETGNLFWKERPIESFASERAGKAWNRQRAGKPALTSANKFGYKSGTLLFHGFKAHRVAWAIHYGEWPKNQIDHINGNTGDNRIVNLRDVSAVINGQNRKKSKNNTSGVCGVYKARNGYWAAEITINRKIIRLCKTKVFEEAVSARKAAEIALGFHENHGRTVGPKAQTIEEYMTEKNICQITFMPETTEDDFGGVAFPASYSVVIGNNRYFGLTIAEAVEKAQ